MLVPVMKLIFQIIYFERIKPKAHQIEYNTHTHTHKKKQPSINHDLLYFGINQIRSQPTGLKTSNLNDNKIKTNSLHLQQYKYANVRQKKKKKPLRTKNPINTKTMDHQKLSSPN